MDKHNLRIAAAVGDAWPEVRAQLVDDFFDRLEVRLKAKLKGWKIEREGRFGIDAYPSFYFLKPAWEGQYGLCIQLGEYGGLVVMGVYRETKTIGKRKYSDELFTAFARRYPTASIIRPWWEARTKMHSPAVDWRGPEVLWRIKTEDAFLKDVTKQLLEMAEITAPIIDALVRKYKK